MNRKGVGKTLVFPRRKEWENRGFPRSSYPVARAKVIPVSTGDKEVGVSGVIIIRMEVDLMNMMERVAQSRWTWVFGLLVVASFWWYYIRHAKNVITDPEARKPKALFKNFIVGQPFQLLAILVVLIAVVALVSWVLDIQLA